MEAPSPPSISHLQFLIIAYIFISCTFQKKVTIYFCVFSFLHFLLFGFGFHLLPFESCPGGGPPQAGSSWSARHHLFPQGPQPRPGSSPTWPALVSRLPLAEESCDLGTW